MEHTHDLSNWQHGHRFDEGNAAAEKSTRRVVWLTGIMMVVEIAVGWYTHSMALLADGWHMSSHMLALALTLSAYVLARRWARDERFARLFSMGTWKIEVLATFASAMILAGVALLMIYESIWRIVSPLPIDFNDAIIVAVIGLLVNLVSAKWLHHGHDHAPKPRLPHVHAEHEHHAQVGHNHAVSAHDHHDHGHDHAHHAGHAHGQDHAGHHDASHSHDHADLNLRAAYLHVVADAATSVLAIAALLAGKYFGWNWLDSAVGVLGALMIGRWSWGLMLESGRILLDAEMDHPLVEEIRAILAEEGSAELVDLHVWRVGKQRFAAVLSLVSDHPAPPEYYKKRLASIRQLVHLSVEINPCCAAATFAPIHS
ncbi:cation diffusion facilitator family transporter [Ampullimonas aquatilis]|uniref:cation diffusion facilitator family transporter n=1 Tax=Ampullimonas aquatilis TaxID=1341549 RepID=UPI003C78E199